MSLITFAVSCQPAEERTTKPTETAAATVNQPTVTITASNRSAGSPAAATTNTTSLAPVPEELLTTEVQPLEGAPFRLADYKGKVVVLDVWATWCPPCRVEVPYLVELQKQYGEKGVAVVGLTAEDGRQTKADVQSFAKEYNVNYKVGVTDEELLGSFMMFSGQGVIPQTFIITPDGKVLKVFAGFDPRTMPAKIRQAVEQALALRV